MRSSPTLAHFQAVCFRITSAREVQILKSGSGPGPSPPPPEPHAKSLRSRCDSICCPVFFGKFSINLDRTIVDVLRPLLARCLPALFGLQNPSFVDHLGLQSSGSYSVFARNGRSRQLSFFCRVPCLPQPLLESGRSPRGLGTASAPTLLHAQSSSHFPST